MDDTINGDMSVYEIGYLLSPAVPEEKISDEVDALRKIITGAGAAIIADELPHRQKLAYVMRRKTVSGSYEKYADAYFGWLKFELEAGKIEGVKKSFETNPSVLRTLLLSTVRENTYLGKRAMQIAAELTGSDRAIETKAETDQGDNKRDKKEAAPATAASVEDMDRSIDEMVKEVI
ncbi:30S ribosomal protein S6 [Patescibacteria group bacterium]|nr:30S ribosomal protein S6 [Patescibacteria group bacterium]MDE1946410.1 30S ribosomal protein S6 [Patescibacteria group bacterium]MDE2011019.1 30S ribosomal protein S6 [Patescibacteria group bacterium]MDE2233042.1 30S ribosomal protein S6 [Patescibacteria group bacterium]